MASTSSGLSKKIVLDLLDDQPGLRADSLDWGVKTHLPALPAAQPTRTTPAAPVTAATATKANSTRGTKTNPLLSKASPATGQIFRSGTTFKQLLDEYNKPHQAPLIKAGNAQDYVPSRRTGFAPEPVEHIELPTIPGKILRPS